MKILLVDDEPLILQGLKQLLQNEPSLGITTIETTTSANEALEIFSLLQPEIVVSDIKMPNMSGLELIRKMKQTTIPFKSIIISSYDDFHYAKEGILLGIENYLIKPINQKELIQTIAATINKIQNERLSNQLWTSEEQEIFKDNLFRRILQNESSENDFQNWQEFIVPFENWQQPTVVVIHWLSEISKAEKKRIIHSLTKEFSPIEFINMSSEELILIIDTYQLEEQRLKLLLSNILDDFFYFGTIGTSVNSLKELHESFDVATKLQSYSLLLGKNNMISEADIQHGQHFNEDFVSQEEIMTLIHNFDYPAMKELLLGFQQSLIELQVPPNDIQNTSIEIALMIYRVAFDLGIIHDDEVTALRNIIEEITKKKTIQEIFDFLISSSKKIMEKFQHAQTSYSPTIQRTLKIIEKDLSVHHSLKTLADDLNMNPAYLGQLFQKEVGTNFSQYCHHLRMKKANDALLHSTNKISDIATSLGYTDISYFYRLYKKDFGITPNKVRANQLLYPNTIN